MGDVFFYHLTRQPLETTLPVLLEKSLAAGWKVAVRGTHADRMEWLDQKLWLGPEEGFLPHGLAGGPHDADQPVLLITGAEAANDPACLMSIDGADVTPEEVGRLDRVCVLFDGHDQMALAQARNQWRALTGAGCKAQYWSEESGRWEKKAES
ncbi:DNA polymerase III subunit chi [Mameliella sediminis]|uniref:DNA polymerase III subunit chi n=1 Tax=Mameliella sediminis TaxID=2836866 RepID=UPI001C463ADE|nr:DNA polymerase III subunit chi [Mameliella sediminis]MBV7393597.1 DNA polymerase III subunit chi [Mameliella sediminis]